MGDIDLEHSFLPKKMGSLFVWGSSSGGLGIPVPEEASGKWCVESPTAVDLGGSKAVTVGCGESHTVVVTEFGEVISFGRNKEGQLGRRGGDPSVPRSVDGLEDVMVTKVACGAQHSVILTASGRAYEFGLLCGSQGGGSSNAQEETTTAGAAPAVELRGERDPLLQRLVRESTERWLVAEHDEEEAQGDDNSSRMSREERAATLGMARMDLGRSAVRIPRLAVSLAREIVVDAACGYAHTLIRTASGVAYSSGYNDRGQLGLGHRVNLDKFDRIKSLDGHGVVRLAAGSQHSLAVVGGGTLYSWGQGSLGQLGLGRRVTGRLIPVKVERLPRPCAACDAGANHSVAVDDEGQTYVFGHVQYNQHGHVAGGNYNDYVAGEYYCVPRLVSHLPAPVVDVSCGANFNLAVTRDARTLVTWGWPSHGVLGRRQDYALAADTVDGLSHGTRVISAAAGVRHAAAVVDEARCNHGRRLLSLLPRGDVDLVVQGEEDHTISCHSLILAARSQYFRGLLRSRRDSLEDGPLVFPSHVASHSKMLLTSVLLNSVVVYLHSDRLEVPPHRIQHLAFFARSVFLLPALAVLCEESKSVSTYATDLASLVGDSFGSDVVLRVGTRLVPAHRAILGTIEYFRAGFHFCDENGEDVMTLANFGVPEEEEGSSGVAYRESFALLRYIYGGQDTIDASDPTHLFALAVAADHIGISHLVRFCERALVDLIESRDSAQACLEFSQTYECYPRLHRTAIEFLSNIPSSSSTTN